MKSRILQIGGASVLASLLLFCVSAQAQVNSGSTGSDGALDFSSINYSTNIVIDMHDHPTGIYNYTYVNIPTNVTVSFIPNANNTPVYWLVQSNVVINGTVNVSGQSVSYGQNEGGIGGPGGWAGASSANNPGQGPGGGQSGGYGGNASYGTLGNQDTQYESTPGAIYGNSFLIPLLGGSGGGAGTTYSSTGGGGGSGAILVAASGNVTINGSVLARGGIGSGAGSGGGIRIVATKIIGSGAIDTTGGTTINFNGSIHGGAGRVRFDTFENDFGNNISGNFTQGYQPIIIPIAGQWQLTIISIGGVSVSPSPAGQLSTPDAVLSAQQNNPIPIVVSCANLPLHSLITVSVKPANGSSVSATGYNDTGTQASSTATISLNIPRGGGLIYATAATGN